MKNRASSLLATAALGASAAVAVACGSGGSSNPGGDAGGQDGATASSSGGSSGSSGGADGGSMADAGQTDAGGGATVDGGFAAGTICNATGTPRTPPTLVKHIIAILFENENYGSVNGSASVAPYIDSLARQCAQATAYNDDCFTDNLLSLPHYLALTSGSNCDTGNDATGSGCITDDGDPTAHTLSTTSIFAQVTSWKAYTEAMPAACGPTSSGEYAAKHNPAVYYSTLASCSTNDVPIAALKCNASATNTPCTPSPSNALTADLANDALPAFAFVTPSLLNDMHDGTITQADNWLSTYMPLIFQSPSYLRGEVAVQLLWDEQSSASFGGPTPNVFISPYITAGTTSNTPMDHFAMLRAWENALGITTYLGCASGTAPGDAGACPADSTADVRAALHW